MVFSNKASATFVQGEVAPDLTVRQDIPLFLKALQRCENFIVLPQGPVTFRCGTRYVHHTRRHNSAIYIPFQFNDVQAYLIEATDRRFRFYKEDGIVLEGTISASSISSANPGVWTAIAHGLVTGDEVFVNGVYTAGGPVGKLNGQSFLVVRLTADTFSLTDQFGTGIPTNDLAAITVPGTVNRIFELITPFEEAQLGNLQWAQTADTMVICSQAYEIRTLTRSSHTSWTMRSWSRYTTALIPGYAGPFLHDTTNYPFTKPIAITGISQANPAVITVAGGFTSTDPDFLVTGDRIYLNDIVGMTELNNRFFTVGTVTNTTAQLVGENSTGYGAWVSGGFVEPVGARKYPACVSFTDDSRISFANTLNNPETMWFSRGPSSAGALRFGDFTQGSNASDGLLFTLAPLRGKVDSIRWMTNTDKYIAVGTFGSVRRLYGASEAEPLTPSSVTAKAANSDGVDNAIPVVDGATTMFIARGQLSLQSLEFDYQIDGYAPNDMNLVSYHLTQVGITKIVRQIARPVIIWCLRSDGVLLGMTYKAKENIAGWHQHRVGGNGFVEDIGVLPREANGEILYLIVKRTINGRTVRFIEYITDTPVWPDPLDFLTDSYLLASGDNNFSQEDENRFFSAQYERQKEGNYLDAASVYDGSAYGTAANATLTVGTGADTPDQTGVLFTTSGGSPFTSDMVGRQIWGKFDPITGYGGGRAEITAYNSGGSVTVTILSEFLEGGASFDPGDWFITATEVSGLAYLEGEIVGVMTDGAIPDSQIVENGVITIEEPASVIRVGYKYRGIVKTFPIDQGGVSGPAQNKNKIIAELAVRLLNSAGLKFGTNPYALQDLTFRRMTDITGRPVPLFTGSAREVYSDIWEEDKTMLILQDNAQPTTILGLDIYTETSDEP